MTCNPSKRSGAIVVARHSHCNVVAKKGGLAARKHDISGPIDSDFVVTKQPLRLGPLRYNARPKIVINLGTKGK